MDEDTLYMQVKSYLKKEQGSFFVWLPNKAPSLRII